MTNPFVVVLFGISIFGYVAASFINGSAVPGFAFLGLDHRNLFWG